MHHRRRDAWLHVVASKLTYVSAKPHVSVDSGTMDLSSRRSKWTGRLVALAAALALAYLVIFVAELTHSPWLPGGVSLPGLHINHPRPAAGATGDPVDFSRPSTAPSTAPPLAVVAGPSAGVLPSAPPIVDLPPPPPSPPAISNHHTPPRTRGGSAHGRTSPTPGSRPHSGPSTPGAQGKVPATRPAPHGGASRPSPSATPSSRHASPTTTVGPARPHG